MDDLIKRLEEATEGSRELDARIWEYLNGPTYSADEFLVDRHLPDYTTSLDAARMLIPDGVSADIHVGPGDRISNVKIWKPVVDRDEQNRRRTQYVVAGDCGVWKDAIVHNRSAALALCIAALRARACAP